VADVHRQLDVQFAGPYRVFDHTGVLPGCPHAHQAGLYLWAVRQPEGHCLVTYVGATCRSFRKRVFESVLGHFSGYDDICDADALRSGKRIALWEGMWRSRNRDKVGQFIDQLPALASAAQAAISACCLFLAPLELPRQLLERCEGAIAYHLRACPSASALMSSDIRYRVRKVDQTPVLISVTSDAPVQGLPARLLA